MKPPRIATSLLQLTVPASHAAYLAGDLEEEFLEIYTARGRNRATYWYLRQVVLSIPMLASMRANSRALADQLLTSVCVVTVPLLLLDRLWLFLYSQIPLKDGLDRAPEYWMANILCATLCALAAGRKSRSLYSPLLAAAALLPAAAIALWGSAAHQPLVYMFALLLLAPAGALIGSLTRR